MPCWKHTIALFSTLISITPHRVLLYIECCLERHTSILLHQCHSTIPSPHYALTAPDYSLQAGRPPSVWPKSGACSCSSAWLIKKNGHRQTIDHFQWLLSTNSRADCPDMALHAQLFDWLVSLFVHWIFLFEDVGVCVCVWLCPHMDNIRYIRSGSNSIYKITSFACFHLLRVPNCPFHLFYDSLWKVETWWWGFLCTH